MRTSTGSAERLQRAAGTWRLEFQQLVYNSPSLLRPRRFSVQGELAILQQLREFSGHEPLAKDTERLFARGALPEGTYVVRDGRWFPELSPEAVQETAPEPQPAAAAAVARPGALEELAKRIIALDMSVRAMQQSLDLALRTLADVASGQMQLVAQSTQNAAPPAKPAAARVAAAAPAASMAAVLPTPIKIDLPPSAADADSDRTPMSLPPIAALSDLVRSLAGPEAGLASTDRVDWPVVVAGSPVFCAVIQDNAGDEAGSMIFDLEAALRLAGALLMESEELITSLLEEKMMSDEMLDAAGEVCNTLTSAFNKVSGNPHVRSGKMQALSPARAADLANARKRDDYRYSQGGRISLIGI